MRIRVGHGCEELVGYRQIPTTADSFFGLSRGVLSGGVVRWTRSDFYVLPPHDSECVCAGGGVAVVKLSFCGDALEGGRFDGVVQRYVEWIG